jgi:hypothetical protein
MNNTTIPPAIIYIVFVSILLNIEDIEVFMDVVRDVVGDFVRDVAVVTPTVFSSDILVTPFIGSNALSEGVADILLNPRDESTFILKKQKTPYRLIIRSHINIFPQLSYT